MARIIHRRRAGYAKLYEQVTAGSTDRTDRLQALNQAELEGAHGDDVAAVRQVLWSEPDLAARS
jgi:hypothetical protein